MTAMGATGAIFLGLSGYALTSRKDFSFMGGFLMAGILVAFLAGLGAVFFEMPAFVAGGIVLFVLLMAGLILYETSNIIHGGESNYIMATVTLYVSIYNLFTSLLHLLGATAARTSINTVKEALVNLSCRTCSGIQVDDVPGFRPSPQ